MGKSCIKIFLLTRAIYHLCQIYHCRSWTLNQWHYWHVHVCIQVEYSGTCRRFVSVSFKWIWPKHPRNHDIVRNTFLLFIWQFELSSVLNPPNPIFVSAFLAYVITLPVKSELFTHIQWNVSIMFKPTTANHEECRLWADFDITLPFTERFDTDSLFGWYCIGNNSFAVNYFCIVD